MKVTQHVSTLGVLALAVAVGVLVVFSGLIIIFKEICGSYDKVS
jgi:hypothetical protein